VRTTGRAACSAPRRRTACCSKALRWRPRSTPTSPAAGRRRDAMNTMYRFEWQQIATEPFLAELVAATGTPGAEPDELRALLARIFARTGGAGVANSDWPASHRTQVAGKLLGEAV